MAPIPFLGRLHPYEYLALILSFVLTFLEIIVRTITLLLPTPIIRFLYRVSRDAFNSLSSPYSRRARNKKRAVTSPIAQAQDFVELCRLFGYYAEEHIVQTKDGYLLGLHRLGWRLGEEDQRVNAGPGSVQKKVVYLHHGLLMNSEVWVCLTEQQRCLPFTLVEQGYDVWLGNNRGNKYSKKCLHHSPAAESFWNFSMDQFAFHDIPDSIDYILSTTEQPSLSYVGFSQGTAQAFATLSIHPTLNSKVDVFVALAPAMAPPGLASGVVSSLVKSHPELLFLLFGRRAILSSTTMWQALLYPAIFCWFIDKSLAFLFGWKTANITPHQKLAAYPHLFSFTSTKSVVHWFQIIDKCTFQMFDDEVSTPFGLSSGSKYYKVAKFPTRNIRTPIVLVYGGSDSLVDIKLMLKELPKHTVAKGIPKYEHLDLLWASDVDKLVFPHILEALESYAQPNETKTGALGWRNETLALPSPFNEGLPPGYSENDATTVLGHGSVGVDFGADDRPSTIEEQMDETDYEDDMSIPEALSEDVHRSVQTDGVASPLSNGRRLVRYRSPSEVGASVASQTTVTAEPTHRRLLSPRARSQREAHRRSLLASDDSRGVTVTTPSPLQSGTSRRESRPKPEGWWSSTSLSSVTSADPETVEPSPTASRRYFASERRDFQAEVAENETEESDTLGSRTRSVVEDDSKTGEDATNTAVPASSVLQTPRQDQGKKKRGRKT